MRRLTPTANDSVFSEDMNASERSYSPSVSNNSPERPTGKPDTAAKPTQANSVVNSESNLQRDRGSQGPEPRTDLLAEVNYEGFPNSCIVNESKLPHPWLAYDDGCYYGMMKGDLPHGKGLFWFSNGDIYIGQWANGLPDSHGYYYLVEGGFYFGKIEQGFANGYGIYCNKAKDLYYQGTFDSGFLDGRGFVFQNGQAQDCYMKMSKIVYRTTRPETNSNRKIEIPPSLNSMQEELTLISLVTNPETEQEAKNTKLDWNNIYYGERNKSEQKHGVGTNFCSNGSRYQGTFIEDKVIGFGVAVDASNNIRTGFFANQGIQMFGSSVTDSEVYVGGYRNGEFEGPACYYSEDHEGWLFSHFKAGHIDCKTYGSKGQLSQAVVSVGTQLMRAMIQKAFGGYKLVPKSLGVSILAGRLDCIKGFDGLSVKLKMENQFFRKCLAQYIEGSHQIESRKKRFNGGEWQNKNKTPHKSTLQMRNESLMAWGEVQQGKKSNNDRPFMNSPILNSKQASPSKDEQSIMLLQFSQRNSIRGHEGDTSGDNFSFKDQNEPISRHDTLGRSMHESNAYTASPNNTYSPRQPDFEFLNDF